MQMPCVCSVLAHVDVESDMHSIYVHRHTSKCISLVAKVMQPCKAFAKLKARDGSCYFLVYVLYLHMLSHAFKCQGP